MADVGSYDFTMYQGETFAKTLTWTYNGSPVAMSGFMAEMQVRKTAGYSTAAMTFQTSDATIVLGASDGSIKLSQSKSATLAIAAGVYSYDLIVTDASGNARPLIAGSFTVTAGVSR